MAIQGDTWSLDYSSDGYGGEAQSKMNTYELARWWRGPSREPFVEIHRCIYQIIPLQAPKVSQRSPKRAPHFEKPEMSLIIRVDEALNPKP